MNERPQRSRHKSPSASTKARAAVTSVVSPYTAGGGGTSYEHKVAAWYMAMALTGAVPRGHDVGVTREVRFQRLYAGQPLDDLVILADRPTGESKLALQVKRDLAFGEEGKKFDAVLRACWDTFCSSKFVDGIDRFGVVLGLYSKTIDENYQTTLGWARRSVSASDFITRITRPGLTNSQQRRFFNLIKNKLEVYSDGEASEDTLWRFLQSMVILHFDLDNDASRDRSYAIESLRHLLPIEKRAQSAGLFGQLVEFAGELAPAAGSASSDTLRLKFRDAFLLPAEDLRDDLERISDHGRDILHEVSNHVGGLTLDRLDIIHEAEELVRQGGFLELVGPPGVGKSALLRSLAERRQGEGPVLVLSGERLSQLAGSGWAAFSRDLQLGHRLRNLLFAIGTGMSPCIFIDGIDRIVNSGGQAAVKDLLRGLLEVSPKDDPAIPWTVIFTAREENLNDVHRWLDLRFFHAVRTLAVPELTVDEVQLVADHESRLRALTHDSHLQPILRNPFLLSVLVDQRMLPSGRPLPPLATEVEVSTVWWGNVVDSGGADGIARQQSLLKVGRRVLKNRGTLISTDDIDARILLTLRSDRILIREPGRDVYRFGHDLLEDWVLARVIDQQLDILTDFLRELGQPLGIVRPIQLVGLFLLELRGDHERWAQLVDQLDQASDLSPRWRQALLLAPLLSARASELLEALTGSLLARDGRLLADVLLSLRTIEVLPNLALFYGAAMVAKQVNEITSLLLRDPVPSQRVWRPLIDWLVPRLEDLPIPVRAETVQIMLIWQRHSPPGTVHRREIGERAMAWLEPIERWYRWDDDDQGDDDE